jgi:hypothetical protein
VDALPAATGEEPFLIAMFGEESRVEPEAEQLAGSVI